MSILGKIESEIAALPPNLRAEVLDFVQFVKRRHGLSARPALAPDLAAPAPGTGDSALFEALTASGFVGCISTNEQLAASYKSQLDFSSKTSAPT